MLDLADAVAAKNAFVESAHHFWAYLNLAAAAAIAFVWRDAPPQRSFIHWVTAAFAVFAAANCWLLFHAQSAAHEAYRLIQAHVRQQPQHALDAVATLAPPASPWFICTLQAALSLAVMAALWSAPKKSH